MACGHKCTFGYSKYVLSISPNFVSSGEKNLNAVVFQYTELICGFVEQQRSFLTRSEIQKLSMFDGIKVDKFFVRFFSSEKSSV